ncbi:MAG: 3-hydroxyacyl-CoA dehydrogenase family protein [Gemmatimonadota bacterium]
MPDDVEPVAPDGPVCVLGAGTMGHGIAQVAAMAGYDTRLHDVDGDALASGVQALRANLEKGVELGKVDPATRDRALEALAPTADAADAADGAGVVVEAVPEDLGLKRSVLSEASGRAADDALLGTNTSSLSIAEIASGVGDAGRVVGVHFFNPVHLMELVEVVRGDATRDDVVARALGFARRLGKTPVLVEDSPGFATSRLGVALGLEATRMVEEGVATPEDIDRAMTLGYNHPMGPCRLGDLVGHDVRLEIARYLHRELGERFRPPELLERMVEEGKLGKKSGEGFYEW